MYQGKNNAAQNMQEKVPRKTEFLAPQTATCQAALQKFAGASNGNDAQGRGGVQRSERSQSFA